MNNTATKTVLNSSQSIIALGLMDACWLYIVMWLGGKILFGTNATFSLPQPLILAVMEVGGWAVTSVLLERARFSDRILRGVIIAVGLVLALVLALVFNPFPAQPTIFFFLPFLSSFFLVLGTWMLGGYHASEAVTYDRVYEQFRLGLIAISCAILLVTVIARANINTLWVELAGVALLFFGSGLAALALSNRQVVQFETGDSGLRSWAPLLVGSVAAILLLAVVVQGIGQGDIVGAFQNVVLAVAVVIVGIIYGVIAVLLWPLSWFNFHIKGPLVSSDPTSLQAQPTVLDPLADLRKQFASTQGGDLPVEWQIVLMALVSIVIVGAVVYVLARWIRNTRRERDVHASEEHEQFGSWGLFIEQLKGWLRRLLARFRKATPATEAVGEDDLSLLAGKPEWEGTLTVRQIYAKLLRSAKTAGYPRSPQQTPSEYLRMLSRSLPEWSGELQTITSAYIEARYSPNPASPVAVRSANEAWKKIDLRPQEKK